MNPTGNRTREQYADIGCFTDLVLAATSLLGYVFIPRIRDLPSKRLYVFDQRSVPIELKGLVGAYHFNRRVPVAEDVGENKITKSFAGDDEAEENPNSPIAA